MYFNYLVRCLNVIDISQWTTTKNFSLKLIISFFKVIIDMNSWDYPRKNSDQEAWMCRQSNNMFFLKINIWRDSLKTFDYSTIWKRIVKNKSLIIIKMFAIAHRKVIFYLSSFKISANTGSVKTQRVV